MPVMSVWKTEEKIFKRIHLMMAVLFVLLLAYIVTPNPEQRLILLGGFGLYFVLAVFRHFYLSRLGNNLWQWVFPYLEGAVVYYFTFIDSGNAGLSIFILVAWDIALDYKYSYGVVYSIVMYLAYMSIYVAGLPHPSLGSIILVVAIAAVQFILYIGIAFLAKGYSLQSKKLRQTTAELHAKMISMEEMTVLKERNRIALEIHNTVGHQLTTALVQIEAAQMLMEKDPEESKRRLGIIKEQVRTGLKEIRQAIHAIKAENEYNDFADTVHRLLEQVRDTKISVECSLDDIEEGKLFLKKTLYHVILESITNAIKHGQCRKIKVFLTKEAGLITLSCFNDGVIPQNIQYGYGLTQMKEQLKTLGGSLTMRVGEDGWFGLVAEVPIFYREGDEDATD